MTKEQVAGIAVLGVCSGMIAKIVRDEYKDWRYERWYNKHGYKLEQKFQN